MYVSVKKDHHNRYILGLIIITVFLTNDKFVYTV